MNFTFRAALVELVVLREATGAAAQPEPRGTGAAGATPKVKFTGLTQNLQVDPAV